MFSQRCFSKQFMSDQLQHFYEFGRFRLKIADRVLLRDLEIVPLTPKVFDILLTLVESSGQVVSKDGLMKRVWPDSFVEEGNLTQNISLLRKALGEGQNGRQYIETVARRGYRFVAPVYESRDSGPDSTRVNASAAVAVVEPATEVTSESEPVSTSRAVGVQYVIGSLNR